MDLEHISKLISLVLRHKPEYLGLTLDEHGWADVGELVRAISWHQLKYRGFNMRHLEEIVNTDEKMRYSFNEDKTLIRANQGHSIPVDLEFKSIEPPKYLYHGTGEKYKESIDSIGLIPKSRLYVHLSEDLETASDVGRRHGTPIVYRISSSEMYKNGFIFHRSANGVWLTKRVPVEYMELGDWYWSGVPKEGKT